MIGPSQRTLPDSTQQTDIHADGGIRMRSPSKWAVADPRLRTRGHCKALYPFMSWVIDVTLQHTAHVTVSQYCDLTVRIHISISAAVYLVCLAKLGAAALTTRRTCWMQMTHSQTTYRGVLSTQPWRLHLRTDWCTDHDLSY